MIFIERILFSALSDGLDVLKAKPKLFEAFLVAGGLSAAEALEQRAYFVEKPPTVLHGYARAGGVFPCWAITLGAESTDQDYLGEDASLLDSDGEMSFDEDGNPEDHHIRRWSHSYEIWTYADHPDACLYYYYLSKQLLQEARSSLQSSDLDEITFLGNELAPDPKYLPSDLFVRRLMISLKSEDCYVERLRPGTGLGTQVDGIHVREDDEAVELGGPVGDDGVRSNVSVYNPDEE